MGSGVELLRPAQKRLRDLRCLCSGRTLSSGGRAHSGKTSPKAAARPASRRGSEHSGSGICAASLLHLPVRPHPPAGKAGIGRFAVPWAVRFHHSPEDPIIIGRFPCGKALLMRNEAFRRVKSIRSSLPNKTLCPESFFRICFGRRGRNPLSRSKREAPRRTCAAGLLKAVSPMDLN